MKAKRMVRKPMKIMTYNYWGVKRERMVPRWLDDDDGCDCIETENDEEKEYIYY